MAKRKWVTIVGDFAPAVEMPPDSTVTRYVLETVTNAGDGGACTDEQRAALLYERGVGPQRPDEKPEPVGGPRDRRTFRPVERPPKVWDGRGE